MGLVFGIVGSFSLKWHFSSFVLVIRRGECIFSFLRAELRIVCGGSLEFTSIGGVLMETIPGPFDRHFLGLVILGILGLTIKLPSPGPVIVFRWRNRPIFYLVWNILSIIGSFQ